MHPSNIIPIDAITNTRCATVLATLGLQFARPGIYIMYDQENPRSSGGMAHFLFESSIQNTVRKYVRIYDECVSDVTLDQYLEKLKAEGILSAETLKELESKIAEALVSYGRKFLDNYAVIVKGLKEDIGKFAVTGGTPVLANGKVVGRQEFILKGVR